MTGREAVRHDYPSHERRGERQDREHGARALHSRGPTGHRSHAGTLGVEVGH
jgi:hypothetical protein